MALFSIEENQEKIKQQVNTVLDNIEENLLMKKMNVECLTASVSDRERAVNQGTTVGKYIDQQNQLANEKSLKEQQPIRSESPKSITEENHEIRKTTNNSKATI